MIELMQLYEKLSKFTGLGDKLKVYSVRAGTEAAQSLVNNLSGFVYGYQFGNFTSTSPTPILFKVYDKATPGSVNAASDIPIITILSNGFAPIYGRILNLFPTPFQNGLQLRICTGVADTDTTASASSPRLQIFVYEK